MFGRQEEEKRLNQILQVLREEQAEKTAFYAKTSQLIEVLTQGFVELRKRVEEVEDAVTQQATVRAEQFLSVENKLDYVRSNQNALNKDVLRFVSHIAQLGEEAMARDNNLYQELLKTGVELQSLLDYAEFDTAHQELMAKLGEIQGMLERATLVNPIQVSPLPWSSPYTITGVATTGTTPTIFEFPGQTLEDVESFKTEVTKEKKKRTPRKHILRGDAEDVKKAQDMFDTFGTETDQGKD